MIKIAQFNGEMEREREIEREREEKKITYN
jgi:hypothetical protein